jgi:hypothetical protein
MRKIVIAAALGLFAAPAALAADSAPGGRFTLTPSANGYVRLDTQTGQVSECTGAPANLICKSTPDERAAMQADIDRLQKQMDDLKGAAPGATAQNGTPPGDEAFNSKPGPQVNIPSDQDVDKAFNFMDHVVKRFKGLIEKMHSEPSDSTPL